MEILWVIAFFVGVSLISWIVEQVQEYIEGERSKQRDEIASNVLADYGLSSEDRDAMDKSFAYVLNSLPRRAINGEEYEISAQLRAPNLNDLMCPTCRIGFLVRRHGRHGAFLGCVRYPKCKTTKPIGWANKAAKAEAALVKEAQKIRYAKQFMEDLKKAYN